MLSLFFCFCFIFLPPCFSFSFSFSLCFLFTSSSVFLSSLLFAFSFPYFPSLFSRLSFSFLFLLLPKQSKIAKCELQLDMSGFFIFFDWFFYSVPRHKCFSFPFTNVGQLIWKPTELVWYAPKDIVRQCCNRGEFGSPEHSICLVRLSITT